MHRVFPAAIFFLLNLASSALNIIAFTKREEKGTLVVIYCSGVYDKSSCIKNISKTYFASTGTTAPEIRQTLATCVFSQKK